MLHISYINKSVTTTQLKQKQGRGTRRTKREIRFQDLTVGQPTPHLDGNDCTGFQEQRSKHGLVPFQEVTGRVLTVHLPQAAMSTYTGMQTSVLAT